MLEQITKWRPSDVSSRSLRKWKKALALSLSTERQRSSFDSEGPQLAFGGLGMDVEVRDHNIPPQRLSQVSDSELGNVEPEKQFAILSNTLPDKQLAERASATEGPRQGRTGVCQPWTPPTCHRSSAHKSSLVSKSSHLPDVPVSEVAFQGSQSSLALNTRANQLPLHIRQAAEDLCEELQALLFQAENPGCSNMEFCLHSACNALNHLASVAETDQREAPGLPDPEAEPPPEQRPSRSSRRSASPLPGWFQSNREEVADMQGTSGDFKEAASCQSIQEMKPWMDEVRADLGSRRKSFRLVNGVSENEGSTSRNRCYLHPESNFRRGWDLCSLMLIISLTILIPLDVCFFWEDEPPAILAAITNMMDVFFMIDIVLNFFTAFHEGHGVCGRLVTDFRGIAKRYARGWLCADIVASFPLLQVLRLVGAAEASNNSADILKVLRYAKIARMFKVVRVLKLGSLIQMFEEKMVAAQSMTVAFQLIKMTVVMMIISHNVACVWYAVAAFPQEPHNWLSAKGLDGEDAWEQYVAAFYFAITTGTTVGYGDISPQNSLEQIVTTFVLVLSVAYIGQFLARVSQTVSSLRHRESLLSEAKRDALLFMSKRAVPKLLQVKVTRYIEHVFETDAATALDQKTMDLLSESLKNQLALAVTGGVLSEFPFFAGTEEAFLTALCQVCRTQRAGVGDIIVAEEQASYEMFFMVRGEARVLRRKSQVGGLRRGDWFGELSLFLPGVVRQATVQCETNCEFVVLHHDKFRKAIEEFPKVKFRYHKIASSLRRGHTAVGLWPGEQQDTAETLSSQKEELLS